MRERVRLVVFDLGGVIVRIVRTWEEAHEAAGLGAKPVPTSEAFRRERIRLAQAHQVGAIESDAYFEEVARASGGGYTPEEVKRVIGAWMYGEYDGVGGVVDALEAAGVEPAALSNTNDFHWQMLRMDGASSRFSTVARLKRAFASHIVGAAKPDSAMYEELERQTGVAGGRILFFDDLPDNVAAARSRGWRAETINPLDDTAPQILRHLSRHGVFGG